METIKEIQKWFPPCRRRPTLRANMLQMRTLVASIRFMLTPSGESGIETAFCIAAELSPYVLDVGTQLFTCEVRDDDGVFTYTPDAVVLTCLGACVVECKPFWKRADVAWGARCNRLHDYFATYGLRFVIIDELDVFGSTLRNNLAWLWHLRRAMEFEPAADRLVGMLHEGGALTIDTALSRGFTRFQIGHALATRRCFANLHHELGGDALLRPAPYGDYRDLLSKLAITNASDLRYVIPLEEEYQ